LYKDIIMVGWFMVFNATFNNISVILWQWYYYGLLKKKGKKILLWIITWSIIKII